jgi:hypothetical protein
LTKKLSCHAGDVAMAKVKDIVQWCGDNTEWGTSKRDILKGYPCAPACAVKVDQRGTPPAHFLEHQVTKIDL